MKVRLAADVGQCVAQTERSPELSFNQLVDLTQITLDELDSTWPILLPSCRQHRLRSIDTHHLEATCGEEPGMLSGTATQIQKTTRGTAGQNRFEQGRFALQTLWPGDEPPVVQARILVCGCAQLKLRR
jgi:hypothetical protein